mmetsp:Transcript_12190/g.36763  ORF Transcript_12190/g.36763 Transcript_12190/m.36763 type:complete len:337 (-) Transcript_12190:251-1261(-)
MVAEGRRVLRVGLPAPPRHRPEHIAAVVAEEVFAERLADRRRRVRVHEQLRGRPLAEERRVPHARVGVPWPRLAAAGVGHRPLLLRRLRCGLRPLAPLGGLGLGVLRGLRPLGADLREPLAQQLLSEGAHGVRRVPGVRVGDEDALGVREDAAQVFGEGRRVRVGGDAAAQAGEVRRLRVEELLVAAEGVHVQRAVEHDGERVLAEHAHEAHELPRRHGRYRRRAAAVRRRGHAEAGAQVAQHVRRRHALVRPVVQVAADELVGEVAPGHRVQRLEREQVVPLLLPAEVHHGLDVQQQHLDEGGADLVVQQRRRLRQQPPPVVARAHGTRRVRLRR